MFIGGFCCCCYFLNLALIGTSLRKVVIISDNNVCVCVCVRMIMSDITGGRENSEKKGMRRTFYSPNSFSRFSMVFFKFLNQKNIPLIFTLVVFILIIRGLGSTWKPFDQRFDLADIWYSKSCNLLLRVLFCKGINQLKSCLQKILSTNYLSVDFLAIFSPLYFKMVFVLHFWLFAIFLFYKTN